MAQGLSPIEEIRVFKDLVENSFNFFQCVLTSDGGYKEEDLKGGPRPGLIQKDSCFSGIFDFFSFRW